MEKMAQGWSFELAMQTQGGAVMSENGVKEGLLRGKGDSCFLCFADELAKKQKEKMNCFEEEVSMPLSPMADYFSSSLINVFVLGVLESEIPIDDSRVEPLLKDAFLPISTRFSPILVIDKKGKKGWKEVEVNIKEHIKIPTFPAIMPLKLYDEYLDEYMSKIDME
ncbi:O-acyltransferase WSD [Spatholobus suberectus]|nr:O-acyltransferase WSD [Spatholobus suberectus]